MCVSVTDDDISTKGSCPKMNTSFFSILFYSPILFANFIEYGQHYRMFRIFFFFCFVFLYLTLDFFDSKIL